MAEQWLTPAQVRERLQISAELTYRLIASGEIRSARVGSRCIRVSETALVEFMQTAEQKSATAAEVPVVALGRGQRVRASRRSA